MTELNTDVSKLVDSTMDRIIQECKTEGWFLGTVNAREVIRKHIARSLTDLEAENAGLRESREFWKRVSYGWSQRAEAYKARLAEALNALDEIAADDEPADVDGLMHFAREAARRVREEGKVDG